MCPLPWTSVDKQKDTTVNYLRTCEVTFGQNQLSCTSYGYDCQVVEPLTDRLTSTKICPSYAFLEYCIVEYIKTKVLF